MRSVWQHVARLNKTLMSSSSISTSGMSRTWSELAISASKLNIAKYTWTRRCEVWQCVARLNKTLMSSPSISISGMSRTWSELVVYASKLNIVKYSEDVMKLAAPSIAVIASVVVFPMSINNLNIFMELLVGHHHAHRGFCCWGRWCCEIKLSTRRDGIMFCYF